MKCKNLCSVFFFLLFLLVIDAEAFTQGTLEKKLTLQVKHAGVKEISKLFEEQSQITSAYSTENILKEKLSINVESQSIGNVLEKILDNQDLTFEAVRDLVVPRTSADLFQQIVISGKVVDENGDPLPGVTVQVKGNTTVGTTTDLKGSYSLQAPDENGTLVFSFIGFIVQEIPINKKTVIKVSMMPESRALSEVVVRGYGIQKRENVIGSISTLGAEKLQNRPVTQLQNALTGQLPGVTVTQRNARPGSSSGSISIRGVGSFGADPAVLILVDNIPVGGFNDIDPNDVENISVLKDASSAAIYGARAANGVILVTTKSGAKGKTKVSYSSYFGAQVPTAIPKFVNSYEYALGFNEGSPTPTFPDAALNAFRDGTDPDNYPNVNFLDSILKKSATQTGHNVNVSGGTDINQYNLSLGYLFQDGLVEKNNYRRYNVRLNMTTKISPKLSMTTRVSFISSNVNEPGTSVLSLIDESVRLPPGTIAIHSNGDYGVALNLAGTPISVLASKSFLESNNLNLNGNLRLDYSMLRGLKLSGIGSYVLTNGNDHTFFATQKLRGVTTGPNKLTEAVTFGRYYTFQGLADYNKQFGRHQVNLLGGYSFEKTSGSNLELSRTNFPSNDKPVIVLGSPATQQTDGTAYVWVLESQFARANYSYASKYLLEGVIRRDGSSRFPSTNKYAYFPSIALGWRIGQEKFIKDNYPWISELKLKASRGVLGNQNISNYPYQNVLGINSNALNTQSSVYSLGGTVVQGVSRTQIVDPTLHWESTRTTDAGLEFGVLNNSLTGSASYFKRYTYDILVSPASSVSTVLGFGIAQQNSGSLENKGWEFTLNYNKTVGKVGVNISTNFSIINNKALDLGVGNILQPNGLVGNGSTLFVGYPLQIYYGYQADGLFVDQTDIDSWPKYNTAITSRSRPGDIRYKDLSGPNGKPDGMIDATYDRTYLGSQIPKYLYGINLGANFKGFDVSMLLQGITGVKGNLTGSFGFAYNNGASIQRWQYEGRWTAANPNPNAEYPRLEVISNTGTANTPLSSFWILNGSYLRIKNAQIGYSVPRSLLQKVKISNTRLYFSGENLLTIDNYRKGWDPEVNTGTNFYPILSNYTVGLNVTF